MPDHDDDELAGLDFDITDTLGKMGVIDMTATLVRRFAWDTMPCDDVASLLAKLGLPRGSDEGMNIDHRASHQRMHDVLPLEQQIRAYSRVLGTVITTALMGELSDGDGCDEHALALVGQNAQVILAGTRAILAQLMYTGQITYGPASPVEVMVVDRGEDGNGV